MEVRGGADRLGAPPQDLSPYGDLRRPWTPSPADLWAKLIRPDFPTVGDSSVTPADGP